MILITGCGCSGTTYICNVLRRHGLDLTHDQGVGKDGVVTNAVVDGEVWIYKYGYRGIVEYVDKKLPINNFDKIIHVIRHPLLVISSIMKKWRDWGKVWLHIEVGVSCKNMVPSLHNAMKYWLIWNQKIETYTDDRVKAEDIFLDNKCILQKLNLPFKEHSNKKIASSNKTKTYSWDDLEKKDDFLAKKIKNLALKYGYKD